MSKMSRRDAARLIAAGTAGLAYSIPTARGATSDSSAMLTRAIPSSGEKLPVVGLGSWRTFDIGSSEAERKPLREVLSQFVTLGGRLIDSSPMYGRSEEVMGEIAANLNLANKIFFATKVWTRGKEAGIASMERSFARLRTKKIDLMQVHNLVDAATQLQTMRNWKEQGRIRYIGITHYESGGFPAVESLLRGEKLDFLQINYSLGEREAEQRILPLAQERGVAVLINRPFGGGDLFSRLRAKPVPDWAAEFDIHSWAQFLLKWIVSHPAVTCTIPATNNPRHLEDNMGAGRGGLPDAATRERMTKFVLAL